MNTAITSLYCFPARGENVSDLFFVSCSWDMISMPTLQVGGTAIIAFVIADGNTKTLIDGHRGLAHPPRFLPSRRVLLTLLFYASSNMII